MLPSKEPAVRVQAPVKVWVNPTPRSRVPAPLNVKPAPPMFPATVAVPEALVIETRPVVLNPPILCVAVVPAIVTGELPAKSVPALIKSPWKVNPNPPVARLAPDTIFKGTFTLLPI